MHLSFALILVAALANGTPVQHLNPGMAPETRPTFKEAPKDPNSLKLYNNKGEIVAQCEKKDNKFGNCKLESGVSLDDLMNAWVHAYQDVQQR
jgi:hypothetical protein